MVAKLYPDIELPCGGTASFDEDSGISHRCETCFAVVGSIGMPRECRKLWEEEMEAEEIVRKLKGKTRLQAS